MTDQTILTVIGTRPQLVKASVVSAAIGEIDGIREVLVDTGQHYDAQLSSIFFEELGIPRPEFNLGVGSDRHGRQTARMLDALEEVILARDPALVVVYGDTNSTLAGVLAASKLCVPVVHIEAGLRSFNRAMAEEQNRIVADHLSHLLFAPSRWARENLLREGIEDGRIRVVGDVMLDAALRFAELSERKSDIVSRLRLRSKEFVLATVHRAENTGDRARLAAILGGLEAVASSVPVVLPLHPRTRAAMEDLNLHLHAATGVKIIDPVGYLDMIALERNARVIVTDSGGVQKEAYFYEVPCVTTRPETEWMELVENGFNVLVDASSSAIVAAVTEGATAAWPDHAPLYGDGTASRTIACSIAELARRSLTPTRDTDAPKDRSAPVYN